MFRSLDYDEDLFKKVLEPSNLIYADPSFMQGRPDCEIMISSEVFKEMGLRWSVKEPLYLALDYNGQVMELKVAAVLKNLPDRAEFLCSSRLMYLLSANSNVDHFFTTGEKQELNYIAVKTDQEPDFKFPGLAFADYDAEEFVLNGHEKLVRYTFYFDGFLDPSKMSLIDSVLKKEYKLHCQQRLMWDCKKFGTHFIKPHYIAINFFDLRHIRKFKDELKDRFDIDLEISEVEDKENFSNVTILVSLATAGLALMGVSCFLFFIYFLISDHFEKIKQNLGTFLAFGFSKKELIRVYVRIVFWLISISLLISLLLLCILKICAFLWSGYDYLLIFHPVTIGFVLLYSLCGFIMVWWQAGKILSHAPGDLIYSRK
jgi:hypothetical protein